MCSLSDPPRSKADLRADAEEQIEVVCPSHGSIITLQEEIAKGHFVMLTSVLKIADYRMGVRGGKTQ